MTELAPTGPTETQAKAAFEVAARIEKKVKLIRELWVDLAEDLYLFVDGKLWEKLGYPSFEKWLDEPTIEIGRRQVYYLVEMWRELVVKRGVQPAQLKELEPSKVQEILPAVRRGFADVPEALADCKTLKRDDLREHYSGQSGNGSRAGESRSSADSFDAENEPEWLVCEACGSRYKVRAT